MQIVLDTNHVTTEPFPKQSWFSTFQERISINVFAAFVE